MALSPSATRLLRVDGRASTSPKHATRARQLRAAGELTVPPLADEEERQQNVAAAKAALRHAVSSSGRGRRADAPQRGAIAEAQVAVEVLAAPLDYQLLPGKWRLLYTDAIDVVPLLKFGDVHPEGRSSLVPRPLRVCSIFQQFSSVEEGTLQNIICCSVPFILENEGVTLTVSGKFNISSSRRLALQFESAGISDVKISPELEALIAPAMLPRTSVNHQILLALKEFSLQFSLPRRSALPRMEGGDYMLTYLDEDMLIGRAIGLSGTYVFDREPSP
ncbi:unnamed protein product [Ostreobium quekettii]|uniref:Plastid lipid-associated protein/fibrillin conserved domain-containing protein n=1 Tax=Ostreobium quekettii TaxID=121088 RepID=A0A8S1J0Z1_9CHLO|nr:unnamed protein product [Ostreobium quekettii]|eukprot:evm.model.scf_882.4 EVM.evm.TU.scf_882.4   scf_882:14359-18588(-)